MVTESNKRIKTKRIIQEAMVDLLHRESFDEISTVQLAKDGTNLLNGEAVSGKVEILPFNAVVVK